MALIDGILGYWKLDETSGNAADATGNGFTLTNNNSGTYVPALIENGFSTGTNTGPNLNGAYSFGLNGASSYSISMWIKCNVEVSSGEYQLFGWRNAQGGSQFRTRLNYQFNGGTRRVYLDRLAGTSGSLTHNLTMGTTTFYHFVLTYNGTTASLYLNASSVGTPFSSSGTTGGLANTFCIGGENNETNTARSTFDEVGIWNRVLSAGEITELYNGGAGLSYPFSAFTPTPMMHHLQMVGGLV